MVMFGVMGGGDGKLIAAAVLWTGPETIMPFLLLVALMGGVLALIILLYRRLPLASTFAGATTPAAARVRKDQAGTTGLYS